MLESIVNLEGFKDSNSPTHPLVWSLQDLGRGGRKIGDFPDHGDWGCGARPECILFPEARVESGERLLEVRPLTWLSNPTAARIEKSAARIDPLLGVFPPGIAKTRVPSSQSPGERRGTHEWRWMLKTVRR